MIALLALEGGLEISEAAEDAVMFELEDVELGLGLHGQGILGRIDRNGFRRLASELLVLLASQRDG